MLCEELRYSHCKARKEYGCEWCGQKIQIGELHLNRVYLSAGDFTAARMHMECEKAMIDTPREYLSEGWVFGQFKRGQVGSDN